MAHRPLRPADVIGLATGVLGRRTMAASLGSRLVEALLAERERWLLWLPVGLGAGIALYFALPREPPLWLGPVCGLPLLAALVYLRWSRATERPVALPLVVVLAPVALGLAITPVRTWLVEAPVLERRAAYMVEARVRLVEDRVRGERLLLDHVILEGVDPERTPTLIRVSLRAGEGFEPGDRVRLRALLMPPSPPSEPHGFDFARQAYFMGLGAVGYALGQAERIAPASARSFGLGIARLRQIVADEVRDAVPGAAGAVGVALLTGLRAAIPEHVWHDMQVAGIAHLLAISGLHLGLVAGTLFFAVRIALALTPPLALRLPTKKVAAAIAFCGAFVYLLLTGGTIPTQRAFIMTAMMLLAVMVDRNPFSMRLVAWAALIVLLAQPESLFGASFQMSFAAVVALIAVYETGVARRRGPAGGLDWRLAVYVGGVALTTLVASLATGPLAVYHFGRLPTWGIMANLIAVPLTAFWIMPLGLLGLILMPFGGGAVCFALMGQGIELVLAVAAAVAAWPGAAVLIARPPPAALIAVVLGGLWLCLWRRPWRRLGLAGVALGVLLTALDHRPDLVVDASAQIVAARLDDDRLAVSPWRRDAWITSQWLRGAGQAEAAPWPADGTGAGSLRCDALGCVLARHGHRVAFARRPEAIGEDCRDADLVVSYPRIERCPNATRLIGPRALRRAGGIALWLEPSGIEILTVREVRGDRPWTR